MLAILAFHGVSDVVSSDDGEVNGSGYSFGCLSSVGGGYILNVVFCGLLGVLSERISR
jgi:hypothetical protein